MESETKVHRDTRLFLHLCAVVMVSHLLNQPTFAAHPVARIVLLNRGSGRFPVGTAENLTSLHVDMATSFNLSIKTVDLSRDDMFSLHNKVRTLVCDGVTAFLTADPCSPQLLSAFTKVQTPLIHVTSNPACHIQQRPLSHFHLPSSPPVEDIVHPLIQKLKGKKYCIFYDDTLDFHFHQVFTALRQNLVVNHIYQVTSSSDIGQILGSTIDPTATRYNFIILCNENNTLNIIDQANILLTKFLYQTRWLIFARNANISSLERHARDIDNIAVLSVAGLNLNGALLGVTQEAFRIILQGVNETVNEGFNLTSQSGSCITSCDRMLSDKIQGGLDNSSFYRTCENYELYTMRWAGHERRLLPTGICNQEKHAFTLTDTLFPAVKHGFNNSTFIVGTNFYDPFTMKSVVNGTVFYKGFCFDMLNELARILNFSYVIKEPEDGMWGGDIGNGTWTGLVGQLQRQVVDLVVAPITVSPGRRTVVDFTVPFHYEYTGILVRKPDANEGKWRVIVEPFRWQVWLCIFLSLPFMGLAAWMITHAAVRVVRNVVLFVDDLFCDLSKSCWYVFGALLTQGGAYVPMTMPGRVAVGLWWAFCIILVATYGGNLIAFLTVSKDEAPIPDRETLVDQTRYKWGTVASSVYIELFKNSRDQINQRIYEGIQQFAQTDANIQSTSESDHVALVKNGDYALFWDRTALVAYMVNDCSLSVSTDLFMPAEFSIAVQKGSPYKHIFDTQVNKLSEGGILKYWQKKWFPNTRACGGVPIAQSKPVTILDVQSAFYWLSIGITLGCMVLVSEVIKNKCNRRETKVKPFKNSSAMANGMAETALNSSREQPPWNPAPTATSIGKLTNSLKSGRKTRLRVKSKSISAWTS